MVKFCPECSNLLRKNNENGESFLICKCGYQESLGTSADQAPDQESIRKKTQMLESNFIVVSEEDKIALHPQVKKACPKCEHKKAEAWQVQIRSSDEPSTHFFRCLKCKHTWREG